MSPGAHCLVCYFPYIHLPENLRQLAPDHRRVHITFATTMQSLLLISCPFSLRGGRQTSQDKQSRLCLALNASEVQRQAPIVPILVIVGRLLARWSDDTNRTGTSVDTHQDCCVDSAHYSDPTISPLKCSACAEELS